MAKNGYSCRLLHYLLAAAEPSLLWISWGILLIHGILNTEQLQLFKDDHSYVNRYNRPWHITKNGKHRQRWVPDVIVDMGDLVINRYLIYIDFWFRVSFLSPFYEICYSQEDGAYLVSKRINKWKLSSVFQLDNPAILISLTNRDIKELRSLNFTSLIDLQTNFERVRESPQIETMAAIGPFSLCRHNPNSTAALLHAFPNYSRLSYDFEVTQLVVFDPSPSDIDNDKYLYNISKLHVKRVHRYSTTLKYMSDNEVNCDFRILQDDGVEEMFARDSYFGCLIRDSDSQKLIEHGEKLSFNYDNLRNVEEEMVERHSSCSELGTSSGLVTPNTRSATRKRNYSQL